MAIASINPATGVTIKTFEPKGGATPSSVMVFQPPQASHLPDHLAWVAPQDWQT